ncbi:MAG TPA: M1 family metallopeptidase [Vicinamibacteria bacterium]|nr:M1 family metallopeptidase [Vicinamibacteria bacterium]
MPRRSRTSREISIPAFVFLALLAASSSRAQDEPLSPRNANYRIEVELDPETKMLTGTETLTWRNIQAIPASDLRFHLYWNAWRNNRSTWLLESRLRSNGRNRENPVEGDWSYIDVSSIELVPDVGVPGIDLTSEARFESPDDGNPEDRTLLVLPLPEAIPPEGMAQVEIAWKAKIPRTFARTGFRGDFFFIAQWFPKIAVLEETGWNAHQFHAGTEFYSDYGEYDVGITVPSEFVVGATGREVAREEANGKTRYRFQQADVHDFAWTASPDYLVFEERFDESGLPAVDMTLLLQPEHLAQKDRHFEATRAALRSYGTWYGAYPYGHVTVVDPAYGSGAGGMEYPTFFTAGTRLFNPFGGGSPEGVTVHECGHQFWYGVVGNNEFEHAWLDEGFNTFSTARTMDVTYGDRSFVKRYLNPRGTDLGGFLPVMFDDVKLDRMVSGNRLDGYRDAATWDAQSTPTYRYFPSTGGAHSYNKTALWLATLERYLGWEVLQDIMSTFFERYRFRHPRPQDFFDVANEVSGRDLSWFFDQVYRSSNDFDYGVHSVSSAPVEVAGFDEALAHHEEKSDDLFRTEVVVRRYGAATFPVDVLLTFEDGTELVHEWDGRDRWQLYVEERPSKLRFAAVDPERKLLLDIDYTNNSRLVEPKAKLPARKWASRWMIWLQDLLSTFAFFV